MTPLIGFMNMEHIISEILKQRLSCIPVHIKDHDVIENLIVEINSQKYTFLI